MNEARLYLDVQWLDIGIVRGIVGPMRPLPLETVSAGATGTRSFDRLLAAAAGSDGFPAGILAERGKDDG